MPVKQLQGMPTIQSAVGILLGTFAVIGKTMQESTLYISLIHGAFLPFTPFYKIRKNCIALMLNSLSFPFRNNPRCCVCEAVLPEPQGADQKQPGDGPAEDRNLIPVALFSSCTSDTFICHKSSVKRL